MTGEAKDYISELLAAEELAAQPSQSGGADHQTVENPALSYGPLLEGDLTSPTQPRLNKHGDRRGTAWMDGTSQPGRNPIIPRAYDGDSTRMHNESDLPQSFAKNYRHEKYEHRLVAYLKAEGFSNREIAERTGYHYVSICQILQLPWAKQVIRDAIDQNGQDRVRALLASTAEDSIHTLIAVRDSDKSRPADKISAARELLDRQYGRAAQLTVHTTPQDLEALPDSELLKIARGNLATN